jgi:phage-related protein
MRTCRAIRQGLYEVRTTLPGNRIGRVLFCVAHGAMTLLHGFMKKSQKTPKSDLAVAIDRKRRM